MVDPKLGVLRPRPTKSSPPAAKVKPRPEATVEGDLGRPPTMRELMAMELNPEDVAGDHNAELEGALAESAVTVNGRRVVLSKIRTQEHAGLLLADATAEQIRTEGHYRAWRARLGLEIVTHAKKELPEWRVRQLIESKPNYLTYQEAIAKATGHVMALRAVWETWGDE